MVSVKLLIDSDICCPSGFGQTRRRGAITLIGSVNMRCIVNGSASAYIIVLLRERGPCTLNPQLSIVRLHRGLHQRLMKAQRRMENANSCPCPKKSVGMAYYHTKCKYRTDFLLIRCKNSDWTRH